METNFKKHIHTGLGALILIAFFLAALLGITITSQMSEEELGFSFLKFPRISLPEILIPDEGEPTEQPQAEIEIQGIKKFASESEFEEYLEKAEEEADIGYQSNWGIGMRGLMLETTAMDFGGEMREGMPSPGMAKGLGGVGPQRVSETTVQVAGIDEPDIVKTDGSKIYFSPRFTQYYQWGRDGRDEKGAKPEGETKIINAFPAENLALENDIYKSGELLLWKDTLIIFSEERKYHYYSGGKNYGDKIYGYDISNPKEPKQLWEIKIQDKNTIITSRLFNDKIYLVMKSILNEYHPCPIMPMEVNGNPVTIECSQIYHPVSPLPTDSTFIAMIINPETGKVENKTSFVGSSGNSILYMSENGIYITYPYSESIAKFFTNFLIEETKDLLPASLIEKIKKLGEYDISQNAKMTELRTILEKYINSLDRDGELKVSNEMANRMSNYYQKHKRNLEQTGIVKIGTENLQVRASGNVPGSPLNQFALDEYQGNLRIAITVGERAFSYLPIINYSRGTSANDVYVLDANLGIIGSVKDLGLTERIYSVRFIQDKGYVVTYREVDPFYVLDLSDPYNPELKGELKIPGYSAYLHPITKDKILGIGKEDWKVKVSLFDVSSPENPKETDKYILDEWHSDILNTHHAFLLDKKHNIFFLPGSKGGYVFSYENDELKLKKAISQTSARRAIYIDDYLYIISDNKITVLNEITWKKANELEL